MPAIGVITFELRLDDAHSLKDKRHYVKGLKDRLRAKFNVAVAEIDHQDFWQRGLVAAVTVSPDQSSPNKCCKRWSRKPRLCSVRSWWMRPWNGWRNGRAASLRREHQQDIPRNAVLHTDISARYEQPSSRHYGARGTHGAAFG